MSHFERVHTCIIIVHSGEMLEAVVISLHDIDPDLSCCTRFLAARVARPAFQRALLGPQLPRGGGGLTHSVAGVRRRGRRHSCEQVTKDLLQTSE